MQSNLEKPLDVILDWLCLNIEHDRLPNSFTDKNYYLESPSVVLVSNQANLAINAKIADTPQQKDPDPILPKIQEKPTPTKSAAPIESKTKNWILSYMQESSSDEEDDEGSQPIVPKTLDELVQELEIKKKESSQATSKSDRTTIGMQIKDIKDQIEKITGSREPPLPSPSITITESKEESKEEFKEESKEESANVDDDDAGFGDFFESAENADPPSTSSTSQSTSQDAIPDYSIARWSGKTPKQILLDVLQRMHPRSQPPKFHRQKQGGFFSCTINTNFKSEKVGFFNLRNFNLKINLKMQLERMSSISLMSIV